MTGRKPVLLRMFFFEFSVFVLSADFTDYHRFFISFLLLEGFLYDEGNDRLEASAPANVLLRVLRVLCGLFLLWFIYYERMTGWKPVLLGYITIG